MIKILNSEFGNNALLLNGIIMGVKGFLSFLSAPLIGALSDVYGRKLFLLVTAFFTCVPIPFIKVRCSLSWKQYLDEQLFLARNGDNPLVALKVLSSPQIHAIAYFVLMAVSGIFCIIFRCNSIILSNT